MLVANQHNFVPCRLFSFLYFFGPVSDMEANSNTESSHRRRTSPKVSYTCVLKKVCQLYVFNCMCLKAC